MPVYWGDADHLRALLPDPKAAIFVSDYKGNMQKLADYLTYLSTNETAYEVHRNWRKSFNSLKYAITVGNKVAHLFSIR